MAFKKTEQSGSGSIPFFSEWIKEVPESLLAFYDGQLIVPKTIKSVTSGKGFMLNFDDTFSVFLWKGSSIGQAIKKMINNEEGFLLVLRFSQGRKKFDYEIGFDDEAEVTVTEDRFEESVYSLEITNDYTFPIAPNDFRKFSLNIPEITSRVPVKLTPTPKAINKHTKRSDGD